VVVANGAATGNDDLRSDAALTDPITTHLAFGDARSVAMVDPQ